MKIRKKQKEIKEVENPNLNFHDLSEEKNLLNLILKEELKEFEFKNKDKE